MGYMIIIPLSGHSGKGTTMRTEKRLVAARGEGWRKGLNKKNKYEGHFWGNKTVLYLNCSAGYSAVCFYQNCASKVVNFNFR